jgi:hypothetical protein
VQVFCDATFDTAPPPFNQINFLPGQMQKMNEVPCDFAPLPNEETTTYKKLPEFITSLEVFFSAWTSQTGCSTMRRP